MIYNRSERRLEYPTCKAIETPNHLIINGYLYDKKTLTRVSTEQIDVGWNNYVQNKYRLGVRHRYFNIIRPDATYGTDYYKSNVFYDLVDENGYIKSTAMWIDQDDTSIEWVWSGDSILKIDIHKKTVKRINGVFSTGYDIYASMELGQDSRYLYAIAQVNSGGYSAHLAHVFVFDKVMNTITNPNGLYYGGSYSSKFQIIRKIESLNLVYAQVSVYANQYFIILECANGTIIEKKRLASMISVANAGDSILSKNNQNYTSIAFDWMNTPTDTPYFKVFKFDDNNIVKVDDVAIHDDITRLKNISTVIKSKYPNNATVQGYSEAELRKNFIKLNASVTYEGFRTVRMGPNDEFIFTGVKSSRNPYDRTFDGPGWRWMAVWKQNNPDTDPLDMTMTDWYRYKELNDAAPGVILTSLDKICHNTIIQYLGENGVRLYHVDAQGKLHWDDIYRNDYCDIGFDEFGRLYMSNINNSDVDIYTEKSPTELILDYENWYTDAFFEMSRNGGPVTKKLMITSKNIYKRQVPATYELALSGNAVFASTGSKIVRGVTNNLGKGSEEIKFLAPGTVVNISKRIVYNNELSMA